MASDARDRVTEIYHAALQRRPEDRAAFLDDSCNGDEALRRELESLLGYQSASARFLESPVAVVGGALSAAPSGPSPPARASR